MATMPDALADCAGRITDVDADEMLPAELWVDAFGDVAAPLAALRGRTSRRRPRLLERAGRTVDDAPLDPATVFTVKGPTAPGAIDPARRPAVLDAMGVRRQLLFPTSVADCASFIRTYPEGAGQFDGLVADRHGLARALFVVYNDWAAADTSVSDRVRPVFVLHGDTPDELVAVADRSLAAGCVGVRAPRRAAAGGRSPAYPDLDPVVRVVCPGVHAADRPHRQRGRVRRGATCGVERAPFEGYKVSGEFTGDPSRASLHLAAQNFTMTMILGGVFDRTRGCASA